MYSVCSTDGFVTVLRFPAHPGLVFSSVTVAAIAVVFVLDTNEPQQPGVYEVVQYTTPHNRQACNKVAQ